jgi:excisionase family DNA binding protein
LYVCCKANKGRKRSLGLELRELAINSTSKATEKARPPASLLPPGAAASLKGTGMADAREVMNIRQASHYLGISPDTLYKYVSEEVIPAFKLGNRWKFKKSILDSWMEDRSLSTAPPRPRKLGKPTGAAAGAD